jgi:hypothetical protein
MLCFLLTQFSYFSCCLLSYTTSNHLSFVLSSLFDGCLFFLAGKLEGLGAVATVIGDIPKAPRGGTPVAADQLRGLLQEQRRLIGSCQWVSLAVNPFPLALSLVLVGASDNFNLTVFSMQP